MSSNLAYSLPARAPRETPVTPRHIEIVSTRSQRRARPRVVYAMVAVGGLFVILMVQLVLSIVLSDGAYQISALQTEQKNLARDQQTLTESLHILESPQNLAGQATGLGMVVNTGGSGWLRLSDGAVLHGASAASGANAVGASGESLITNVLLTPDVTGQETATANPANSPSTGAPSSTTGDSSVASGSIPAPTTH